MHNKKIYRSTENRIIGGVAGGIAEYFETDPVIVRIIFIFLCFGAGGGFLIYLFLWFFIPEKDGHSTTHMPEHKHSEAGHPEHHAEHHAGHVHPTHRKENGHGVAGFLLIILGILFLVNNIFPRYSFHKFWPLILIFIGAAIIARRRN